VGVMDVSLPRRGRHLRCHCGSPRRRSGVAGHVRQPRRSETRASLGVQGAGQSPTASRLNTPGSQTSDGSHLSGKNVRMAPSPRQSERRRPSTANKRPAPLSDRVSQQMSRMPRTSTGPEIAIRRALHRQGLRFRLHRRALPGTPDIVLCRAKVAVFIDGCFWHACPDHGSLPKNNRSWWDAKLAANKERDGRKDAALTEMGWVPIHCWEHESPEFAAQRIAEICASRIADRSPIVAERR
jgi:DNA mismatch endonuclease, patch repair protein